MSRASMTITFEDGHKLFGLYCGTSGMVWSSLWTNQATAWSMYHNGLGRDCSCERDEPAVMTTNYAYDYGDPDAITWKVRACRHCMLVTHQLHEPEPEIEEPDDDGDARWDFQEWE